MKKVLIAMTMSALCLVGAGFVPARASSGSPASCTAAKPNNLGGTGLPASSAQCVFVGGGSSTQGWFGALQIASSYSIDYRVQVTCPVGKTGPCYQVVNVASGTATTPTQEVVTNGVPGAGVFQSGVCYQVTVTGAGYVEAGDLNPNNSGASATTCQTFPIA